MGDSYHRRCKWCGKWIQMRQMPAGQWVAFEGYDKVHKCSEENPNSDPGSSNTHTPTTSFYSSLAPNATHDNSNSTDNDTNWGCWVIGIILLVVLFFFFRG